MDTMVKFIDLYWPVEYCNLNCPYCYVHQHKENKAAERYQCSHTPQEIRAALSKERLGGTCLLNICAGGETLLEESIIPIVYELLEEGHYVGIVTNGLPSERIQALLNFPEDLVKRLFFKFSFHYGELKRLDKLDAFFHTIKSVKVSGASLTLELPAYDDFIPEASEIIGLCVSQIGAVPHVATLRDETKPGFTLLSKYSYKELEEKWHPYHSELFRVRSEIMEKKYKGFCYAGAWTFTANMETGEIRQCHYERIIGNLYDNSLLNSQPVGNHCHSEYCYACHAFLTLGDIPELSSLAYYDETRDRKEAGWLSEEMSAFMHQKLYQNNRKLHFFEKMIANERNRKYEISQYQAPTDFLHQTIISMKNQDIRENYALLAAIHTAHMIYGNKLPQELNWMENIYSGMPVYKAANGKIIKITAAGEHNSLAEGEEIWIVWLIISGTWYDAVDIFEPIWLERMRMVGWRSWDNQSISNEVSGKVPSSNDVMLILESNRWRGKCKIQFDEKVWEIDTYTNCDDDIMYVSLG